MNLDRYIDAYHEHPGVSLQTLLGPGWLHRQVSIIVVKTDSKNVVESCVANAFFNHGTANNYLKQQYPIEFSKGKAYVLTTSLANIEGYSLKFRDGTQIRYTDVAMIADYLMHKLIN